ncbi:P-selectin glycoprotein ligand 1 [Chlamydotis macqueenii]
MPAGVAAQGPAASPHRGPMALGRALLVLLVVLSTLRACGALPPPPPQHRGAQWVWGAAEPVQAEPPPLSRRKRADGGEQPSATAPTSGHGHLATTTPSSNGTDFPELNSLLGSVPPPARGTNASPHRALAVPTAADLDDETDSPDLLLSSVPPASPGTNASLHRALAVPTTADPHDETDSPDPDLLLSSAPPAPGTNASLHRALAVPTTADPHDETDSPDPDLLLSSAPPAPGTNASLHRTLAVPTTADPHDETDSPDPDLLLGPGTQAAPQNSVTTIASRLTSPGKERPVAGGTDSSSSAGPRSVTPTALSHATTSDKKVRKAGAPTTPTRSAPWDTKPGGTPLPWDPSKVMGKCLLAILLLALVAATFMVCTGVLGALLWRRARTAHRRLSHTEMVCISSLLPDGEAAANGPRAGPARRAKPLLDGSSDGDNLTLSSFLPEHS